MDEQLKQRVVGAAVLVILGVVFIPMVLHGPPTVPDQGARAPVVVNPPEPATGYGADGFHSRVVPLAPVPPRRPPPSARASAESAASPGRPAPSTGKVPAPVAPPRGWAVQLGAFSDPNNAIALRERLKAKGYPAFVESTTQGGQRVTRVLVGPTPDREDARGELERLRRATGLGGILVRYPPD